MVRVASLVRLREDRGSEDKGPSPGVMRETLQKLIVRELLFQEALARGVSPAGPALERAFDALRAGETDDSRWLKRLAQEGLSAQDLKEELRVQATVAELVRRLTPREPEQVGEPEARAYVAGHPDFASLPERFRLHQILIRLAPDAKALERAAAQRRAESVRDRLKSGADFAALARSDSDDESTRERGGALGLVPRGTLLRSVEEVVDRLQPGQISEILLSGLGFHIFKLEERVPSTRLPVEAVLEGARRAVVEAEKQRVVDELVKQLEAKARIEVYL